MALNLILFKVKLNSSKYWIQFKSTIRKIGTVTQEVIFEEVGDKGIITLNRPSKLNTLNISMGEKLFSIIKQWQNDKRLVIIKGAGDKAFCAGGDVRYISKLLRAHDTSPYELLQNCLQTILTINTYKIPYVSLIDGIVMGIGTVFSIHGPFRVATERTVFAMPETHIGYVTDSGSSYFLPRLPNRLGYYLGLTGQKLVADDVLHAGIATHYCLSHSLRSLENDLLNCSNFNEVQELLDKYSMKKLKPFTFTPYLNTIDYCFAAKSVEEIIERLKLDGSKWALNTVKILNQLPPLSLKAILRAFHLGSKMTLLECLEMEFQLCINLMNHPNFSEGVRAVLEHKDRSPKWNPSKLEEVSEDMLDGCFKSNMKLCHL